jgi:hypothetical protein
MGERSRLWGGLLLCLFGLVATPAQATDQAVRQHADQAFQQLHEQSRQGGSPTPSPGRAKIAGVAESPGTSTADHYLVGKGQGDLAKGKIVCQRVSELAARTDLAKQIRVLVKEHAIDRVRERTGREVEQDIEVVREEIVQEYLQGVKIVDRQIDEAGGTCSATAVMSKNQIQPKPAPDQPELTPTVSR